MSFASALNSYCANLSCTNAAIAKQCGISASALSRYRNGSRVPVDGNTIDKLAKGIAELSEQSETTETLSRVQVAAELNAERKGLRPIGMTFGTRLHMLMKALGIRNADMARMAKVDPSYLSRIRNGQRSPADREKLAEACARMAANWCVRNNEVDRLSALIPEVGNLVRDRGGEHDLETFLTDDISVWLLGDEIAEDDVMELLELFDWLDQFDFAESCDRLGRFVDMPSPNLEQRSEFRLGLDGMHSAELEFLEIAAFTRTPQVYMTSDLPTLGLATDATSSEELLDRIGLVIQRGGHVNIIHSVERPIAEVIHAMHDWIPLYMTGQVTPYYLRGMSYRLFYHVNFVCDACTMSSEAVMDHQDEGRSYLSLMPDDIAYYQRKIKFILEKSSSLLEIYLGGIPGDFERFEEGERRRRAEGEPREICANRYKNVRILVYPEECAIISLTGDLPAHFVVRHPKLRYAISLMS